MDNQFAILLLDGLGIAGLGVIIKIAVELGGFREWRKNVDKTLKEHDKALKTVHLGHGKTAA